MATALSVGLTMNVEPSSSPLLVVAFVFLWDSHPMLVALRSRQLLAGTRREKTRHERVLIVGI